MSRLSGEEARVEAGRREGAGEKPRRPQIACDRVPAYLPDDLKAIDAMQPRIGSWPHVAPYLLSFVTLPLVALGAGFGGWWLLLIPLYGWWLMPVLDAILGRDETNPDPDTPDRRLDPYRMITMLWVPLQTAMLYGTIALATHTAHLGPGELLALFIGVGVITGSVGINFAHELMHRSSRLERWLADILLASTLYGHFRSEHLLVHHTWVGTPRDAVTARYGEGFWAFFARVLPASFRSALSAEAERMEKRGLSAWSPRNPFWRYAGLQVAALALAVLFGGALGLILFLIQALVAVFQLELVNYIEHYGLTRRQAEDGRFEPVLPRHSWNATQRASSWYLLNLQRHSDHHVKPGRPYPLLQTYDPEEAPLLPAGYPVMTLIAVVPPLWRRVMNRRVRAWRRQFYPDEA